MREFKVNKYFTLRLEDGEAGVMEPLSINLLICLYKISSCFSKYVFPLYNCQPLTKY